MVRAVRWTGRSAPDDSVAVAAAYGAYLLAAYGDEGQGRVLDRVRAGLALWEAEEREIDEGGHGALERVAREAHRMLQTQRGHCRNSLSEIRRCVAGMGDDWAEEFELLRAEHGGLHRPAFEELLAAWSRLRVGRMV